MRSASTYSTATCPSSTPADASASASSRSTSSAGGGAGGEVLADDVDLEHEWPSRDADYARRRSRSAARSSGAERSAKSP